MSGNVPYIYEVLHVVPVDDLCPHAETSEDRSISNMWPYCHCKCSPEMKYVNDTVIFIHNSFDGREGVEWVNEILNQ